MNLAVEHIDLPLPADAKQILLQAAKAGEKTLHELILTAALDKAREILQQEQRIFLDGDDWDSFVSTLNNPPEPNAALRGAWRDSQA